MPIDLDDLLEGLGSDDLNDFEDLDDFGDPIDDLEDEQPGIESSRVVGEDLPLDHDDPFLAAAQPLGIVSFATARGKVLPPPSEAALAKARKIVAIDIDDESDTDEPGENSSNKRRRLNGPITSGFTTGGGKQVPPPSHEAMARVAKLFDEDITQKKSAFKPTGSSSDTPGFRPPAAATAQSNAGRPSAMFSTASGQSVPSPSRSVEETAPNLFSTIELDTPRPLSDGTGGPVFVPVNATPVQTGTSSRAQVMRLFGEDDSQFSSSAITPVSAKRAKALAIFGESDDLGQTPGTSSYSSFVAPVVGSQTPFQPPTSTPQRQISRLPHQTSGFRTPLVTTTNTFGSSNGIQPSTQSKPITIQTPGPSRRIGLGGTPSSKRGKVKNSFVTPFKDPGGGLKGKTVMKGRLSQATPLRVSTALPSVHSEVFDLTVPPQRQTLRQAFLKPQYNSPGELYEMGLPDEIWNLDLTNAHDYQFISEGAQTLSSKNALSVLRDAKCALATGKWVDNHYSLILWKLAGEIQAQPSLFDQKWNWGEVIEQLKYRYEREFGMAQRPIIRRIQEHDSASAVPMVLCISGIRRPPPSEDETGKMVPTKPFIELTDGWYRINAEIDDCLIRAVDKGKITVGRKLAVTGAKLDSAGDGDDVLNALDKSRLIISANSCSLARWDAKLGRHEEPFVAGLSHLSNDGGIITLMDIVVEKVFPLAFMNADKGTKEPPWDESEEMAREDQWKERYEAESRRLNEDMQSRVSAIEELTQTLVGYAEEIRSSSVVPPDTLDEDFDQLLRMKDTAKALRSFSDSHIVHLASHARLRLSIELDESRAEVEATLRGTVPRRDIRDFRMIRFIDARQGSKDPARVGMLNVWDARSLGEGALQEGKRYMVSSLMPARGGDWRVPKVAGRNEVYLHTRRETRWKPID